MSLPPAPVPNQFPLYPPASSYRRRKGKQDARLVASIIAGIALVVGFVWLILLYSMGHSDAVRTAIQYAERSPTVIRTTGTPLKAGFILTGQINLQNSDGQAELWLSVRGPLGHGSLYAKEHKHDGIWTPDRLEFLPSGAAESERVYIIEPPS